MKKLMSLLAILLIAIATSSVWAYDKMLAQSYAEFFAPVSGKATGKLMHVMKTPDFIKAIKAGELFVLDIRTPGETGIYGFTNHGSIVIPMEQVFKPENLALLPTDKKIVVICKSGYRAMAVSTALRHIGFKNTYTLKLGIQDLAKHLSVKAAY